MKMSRWSNSSSATHRQSVDRALSILEFLARRGSAGITEIAKNFEVHKSTAFRAVVTMENRQLVEQVEERGKYRLGSGLIRLAGATSAQMDLTKAGRPVCARMAEDLRETVYLTVLDSGGAVKITQEHGRTVVGSRNWLGQRIPLHATSSGKALLAWAGPEILAEVLGEGLRRYTENTITEGDRLRAELAEVRGRGWARCAEELKGGLISVAAPLRGQGGEVIAAVSVSGPAYRMTVDQFPRIVARTLSGAAEISARLGYPSRNRTARGRPAES